MDLPEWLDIVKIARWTSLWSFNVQIIYLRQGIGVGGFSRFMVVAKGMAPTHHTSARVVVPFHVTSYYSCRRCSSLISIPRGNSAVTLCIMFLIDNQMLQLGLATRLTGTLNLFVSLPSSIDIQTVSTLFDGCFGRSKCVCFFNPKLS
jgi:hypothetical protein